jgi:hypothetical protein
MAEIAALDDNVWGGLTSASYHALSKRRVPFSFVSRLTAPLRGFLVRRRADGMRLIALLHK